MDEQKKILVVEYDTALRDMFMRKIESGGYHANYAEEGISVVEKIRAVRPHAVLLDFLMPTEGGVEILKELSKDLELSKIPIVVILSSNQSQEIKQAQDLGVREFLVKEIFNPEEILEKLRRALGEGGDFTEEASPKKEEVYILEKQALSPQSTDSVSLNIFVLIIEDDKFLRELLMRKLLAEKFIVESAVDAEGAFAILQQKKPTIILLDLILPGVSGFDILARVKADPATADVPVIILSNLGQKEDVDRAKSLGAQDFMVKANFTLDEIVAKVHSVVG